MIKKKCLYCYLTLSKDEKDFHRACSKKLFGQATAPLLPYTENNLEKLAAQIIKSQTTVTGVQAKLSLQVDSDKDSKGPKRFTLVDLWGTYILKPPTPHYLHLPEVEDLTMHLAQIAKIGVVPHSLIRMQSGSLSYITKRIDRVKKEKRHMEDMCQLTERLSEDKYHGSYEQIARTIKHYSVNPGLDVINFYEIVLFSFLTGNADMHLKNFSLIHMPGLGAMLAPAYDLVATTLVNPNDKEDLALTLNGKKNKIKRSDFTSAFKAANLDEKQQENIFKRMIKAKHLWLDFIDISFLHPAFKKKYKKIITERFTRLEF